MNLKERIESLKKENITADDNLHDVGWNGAINTVLKIFEPQADTVQLLSDKDLEDLGFDEHGNLETKGYEINILFYDDWKLSIKGKLKYSDDDIFMHGYWTRQEFVKLLNTLTDETFA